MVTCEPPTFVDSFDTAVRVDFEDLAERTVLDDLCKRTDLDDLGEHTDLSGTTERTVLDDLCERTDLDDLVERIDFLVASECLDLDDLTEHTDSSDLLGARGGCGREVIVRTESPDLAGTPVRNNLYMVSLQGSNSFIHPSIGDFNRYNIDLEVIVIPS